MEGQKTELKIIRMSEVESQEVKWLWYPFIPYGKLTIIQGDPGDGKTTLVLNIAAKLSKGECLDSDMDVQEPVNVIYQTAEDGLADTVKPRLELAGADCEKILVIDESDKSLSMADERLEEALASKVTDSTVIIVAQRISTILHADQILVMDEGKIVGKGTHEELLKNCEVYQQIAKSQMSAKELGIDGKEEA